MRRSTSSSIKLGRGRTLLQSRLGKQLLEAAGAGDLQKVRRLLRQGVDPDSRDDEAMTPLHHAVCGLGGADVVRQLLAAGATVDARCSLGSTPLLQSVRDERLDTVRLLVEHGADLNARNGDDDAPLTNAAIWGQRRCVMYLLAQGADPNLTAGGCSAAELARQHGYDDIAVAIDSVREALAR